MNQPRRWLDSSGALSPAERRVLVAGATVRVPDGAKAAVKVAVAAQLAAPATLSAGGEGPLPHRAPASAALKVATRTSWLKFTAAGFVLGVAASAAVSAALPLQRAESVPALANPSARGSPEVVSSMSADPTSATAVAPAASPASPPPKAAVAFGERPRTAIANPHAAPVTTPSASSPGASASSTTSPQLLAMIDESSRLARARALLRNNEPRAALAIIEDAARDYPAGTLLQERKILEIEALQAIGATAAATAAARDFIARYPTSPHAASAQRALKDE